VEKHCWDGGTNDILQRGLDMAVGNGRDTLFWTHNWTGPSPLITLASIQPPLEVLSHRVCDYWEDGRGWKWELLEHLLPQDVLKVIASFELVIADKFQDQLFWQGSHSGRFTIKSALSFIRNEFVIEKADHWRHLGKIKAPQRIKVFAWLALHSRIVL